MELLNQIKLDLVSNGFPTQIDVVQGEAGFRVLVASLYANGSPLNVDGYIASIAYRKADGKNGWYDQLPDGSVAFEIDGNVVRAKLTPQMLNVPGFVSAVIRIESNSGNERAITFPFVVNVHADPGANVEQSEDYYSVQNWDDVNSKFAEIEELLETAGTGIDDTVISKESTWSSKNTVDKLCPSFTESGDVVTCEPLEGYPLEVITKLPTENGVSKITLQHGGGDESNEYTVDLGDSYSNGSYNWTTGELNTEDEGLIQLTPKVIIGLPGENTFHSDCGKTTVSGRLDPNQYWSAKLAEQEAIIAGLNKQYELIEDFTTDKDVSQITRTKDLNGVAYNFSAVKIVATFAVAARDTQAVFYVRDKDNNNIFYHTAASGSISNGDTRKSVVTMYNDGGLTNYNALTPTTNKGSTAIAYQAIPSSCGREWKNIAAIYITTYSSSGSVPIPAGTRILIYGIRG